jgi:hypothetical protein
VQQTNPRGAKFRINSKDGQDFRPLVMQTLEIRDLSLPVAVKSTKQRVSF